MPSICKLINPSKWLKNTGIILKSEDTCKPHSTWDIYFYEIDKCSWFTVWCQIHVQNSTNYKKYIYLKRRQYFFGIYISFQNLLSSGYEFWIALYLFTYRRVEFYKSKFCLKFIWVIILLATLVNMTYNKKNI